MWRRLALLVVAPIVFGGCAAIVLVPRAIDQMTEGAAPPTGFEYHRHDGSTESGSPFRIRHLVDPGTRQRYVIASIDGKLFSSRRDDITRDIDAARAAYPGIEGKTDAEVSRLFGAPDRRSRFEDVQVFWYLRERDDVFVLVFRQGRLATAFRTTRAEMERILEKPSPYAAAGATTALRRSGRTAR